MPTRSHILTLWLNNQLWEHGFLNDPPGEISLYSSSRYRMGQTFTAETLPKGVKVCPNLSHGHAMLPWRAQEDLREAALRHGFELFEIDIIEW
jgi:hypothetical protein